jgi:hypothetical protein
MKSIAALVGITLLATSFAWADHYGSMSLPPSTVHLSCKNVDDDVFVTANCNNTSYGTPLHFQEDCEITAVAQTKRREWEGEGIIVVTHPVPGQFVSSQTFDLDSEDSDGGPGLISQFLVHITANTDGSFTATMDNLSLRCAPPPKS